MGNWIDFRELRSKLNFRDVLEKYQVRLQFRSGGKQAIGPCPLPNHSGNRIKQSFSANIEKGIFQCFSCEAKGNVLDFACRMEGLDPEKGEDLRTVALRLAEHFQIRQERSKATPSKPAGSNRTRRADQSCRVIINAPLDFELKDLDPRHDYLARRRIEFETAKFFGLGFCSRGRMAGRLAIPIHNPVGKLVGYAGRIVEPPEAPKDIPKYLFPGARNHEGATHEFKKSLLLYNAHRITAPVSDLIIVEGFASVWWLTQNGFPNCVAVMGSAISEEQVKLVLVLVREGGRLTLFPDRDEAGVRFAEQATKVFAGKIKTRCVGSIDGIQPTDLAEEELVDILGTDDDIPAGRGGGISPRHDICHLIDQFPCFKPLKITPETWDAEAFERQAGKFSSGELSVAQFILGLWNPTTTWKCGKFDLIETAAHLDDDHRQVIIDWFSDPWWP
jgi:DNA primase